MFRLSVIKFIGLTLWNFFPYLFQGKITWHRIKSYFKGNIRLIKYEKLPWTIKEQFYYRITRMNPSCLQNKQCPCECPFPAKQLDDDSCELNCYPIMLSPSDWELFKEVKSIDIEQVTLDAKEIIKKIE